MTTLRVWQTHGIRLVHNPFPVPFLTEKALVTPPIETDAEKTLDNNLFLVYCNKQSFKPLREIRR
ncbi:hypothetical protein D6833_11335 [Candidatus Parcubacteria bacterium]|nr:MAG: hypothetical protein D6833_11335 [Candidatus Parcubacteria bacterium]